MGHVRSNSKIGISVRPPCAERHTEAPITSAAKQCRVIPVLLELVSTPNAQSPTPNAKHRVLGWKLGVDSFLEIELSAELHEAPVHHLRRLQPGCSRDRPGCGVRVADERRRARVGEIVE